MALPQQKLREVVFQLLYSFDFVKTEDEDMIPFLMHQLKITKKWMHVAQEKTRLIQAKEEELDALISETSKAYNFDRITGVERNILRLSLYEMLYDMSIPPKVAMAEAVRLARKFASPEGAGFVNGILDAVFAKSSHEEKGVENVPAFSV